MIHGGNPRRGEGFAFSGKGKRMKISSDTLQASSTNLFYQSRIDSTGVAMQASHKGLKDFLENLESVQSAKDSKEVSNESSGYLNYSSSGMLKDLQTNYQKVAKLTKTATERQTYTHKLRQAAIMHMLEFLFGQGTKKLETEDPAEALLQTRGSASIDVTSGYMEVEQSSFQMQGTVVTEDGKEIQLDLNLQMSRSFAVYYHAHYELPNMQQMAMMDPLVINLDAPAASLSDQTFTFDLDMDGEENTLHTLGHGSGYLALDKNEDGIINDGSELFGTKSGDGFKDLAEYDQDHNGWIDENDPIFSKLRIWVRDEEGNNALYGLAEKGVGAICLQSAYTQMALNGMMENEARGAIRKTGMFLFENGMAGTVQHVDLVS